LLDFTEVHESGNGPGEDRTEKRIGGSSPDAAGDNVMSTAVVALAAILLVAAVLFVIFADMALRGQDAIPDALKASVSVSPHTAPPPLGGLTVVTPESIIIDLPLPNVGVAEPLTPTVVPARMGRTKRYEAYIVDPGDTLAAIASRFGLPFQDLAAVNGIDEPFTIRIGQKILIPNQ
jgi:LysM repeat protein